MKRPSYCGFVIAFLIIQVFREKRKEVNGIGIPVFGKADVWYN
jgi:hypothetical protein